MYQTSTVTKAWYVAEAATVDGMSAKTEGKQKRVDDVRLMP